MTLFICYLLIFFATRAFCASIHASWLIARQNQGCPAVWSTISDDLGDAFFAGGKCNDLARGAIRYAFHDAATFSQSLSSHGPASGGADGSLLLNGQEIKREENAGLEQYHGYITRKFDQYESQGVGAADLVQFAGAVAIVTCPGGPTVRALIGRNDSSEDSPRGLLPTAFGPGSDHDTLLQLFQEKGFSAVELAALIGAHTVSKATAQREIRPGTPQDTTPGAWDVQYYANVYKRPRGIAHFDSDLSLSDVNTTVGEAFQSFVGNRDGWLTTFASAMSKMSLLGVDPTKADGFIDCTDALPRPVLAQRKI